MWSTLLRLGLWITILVLALYVIDATYANHPLAELIETAMLQQVLILGAVLIVAGIILRILGKGAQVVTKNRCRVCKTPVPSGALYCRAHLRDILHSEDEKTHMPRVRR